MGCDIHSRAEVRYQTGYGPAWYMICDQVFKDEYFNERHAPSHRNVPYSVEPFQTRSYILFALLSGVRNYSVDSITPIIPLFAGRGIPDDASDSWKEYADDLDFHSHGWATLRELKAIDQNVQFQWSRDGEVLRLEDHVGDTLDRVVYELTCNAPRIGEIDQQDYWKIQRGQMDDPRPVDEDGIRVLWSYDN